MTGEPSLDELLDDDIMGPVTRSAGTTPEELRRTLTELARRLGAWHCHGSGRGAGV
jgi:hypothetical protein